MVIGMITRTNCAGNALIVTLLRLEEFLWRQLRVVCVTVSGTR